MKKFTVLFMILFLAAPAAVAWADAPDKMDQLAQRVEELEKKLAAKESESADSEGNICKAIRFSGTLAGAYQFENASGPPEAGDFDRGGMPIQLELSIQPTGADEIFFKVGVGAGNGLNTDDHAFVLAPWAADLEDDVKEINGRSRDYLLAAWYAHTFEFSDEHSLGITGGIIDTTDYLDDNAYANCEYTQFMNEALVNGPHAFLPSYDIGGALVWDLNGLSIRGVVMQVGENDEGQSYHFYGVQAGYTIETPLGEGTYRIMVDTTSDDFHDADGAGSEALKGGILSCDQALGEIIGVWIRFGWSDDAALIDFQDLYSGGIHISGKLWGREEDNLGLGYGYLSGGNQDIDCSQVAEGYVRFALSPIFAVTLDVQYLDDQYNSGAGEDVEGWISGVRLTAMF